MIGLTSLKRMSDRVTDTISLFICEKYIEVVGQNCDKQHY